MAGIKKLKVGILTFWWSNDNYGQLLQCYALQKYLRDAGHDAFLIRYNSQNDFTRSPVFIRLLKALNPILLFKYLNYRVNSRKSIVEAKLHDRHFIDFRNKYIVQSEKIYSSYSELKENPPEADVYIAGSDQVWNFSFCKNIKKCRNLIHAYFLDFGKPETKRISYAASWSCSDLYPDIIEEIRPLIAKFDYVSVREKGGIELCRKCGYENAELVPDPTLLLSAEDYRKIYSENKINVPHKPYLLLYMLSNACDFDIDNVYDFAAEKNLDVIYVTGNSKIDRYKKKYATIPEWLYLVDNAEYVVTNSFHCCVFSLILKKKFGVVPLKGDFSSMNVRIDSLLEDFGLKSRIFSGDFEKLFAPVDFESVNKRLEEVRKCSPFVEYIENHVCGRNYGIK
ncbi:polysaccharide pyruvyl transferase family protein [uncultured Treponema sp.]|uniref:polysaccharide pyruvyl transferase family protein n=1 Tax=uncultured Treponema sp. TaxID=162155 RepID=UPI0025F61A18|nr:polysaccharide pyruvyl transferase family protein [uncultured Treponema sp.]